MGGVVKSFSGALNKATGGVWGDLTGENASKEAILRDFTARKTHFGIKTHALEKMLGL